MPAKISFDLPTNNQVGIINVNDVHKVINDFEKKIELNCSDPSRNPIQKHLYFDISMERLNCIIGKDATEGINAEASKDRFRIYFAVTMPNQLNCENTASVENYLSILVCGINKNDKSPLLKKDNYVLVEGFKDHVTTSAKKTSLDDAPDCCVNGGPVGG